MFTPLLTAAAALIAAPRLVLALVIAFGGKDRREHALRGLRILSVRGRTAARGNGQVTNR